MSLDDVVDPEKDYRRGKKELLGHLEFLLDRLHVSTGFIDELGTRACECSDWLEAKCHPCRARAFIEENME